jgi:hypothetical protein
MQPKKNSNSERNMQKDNQKLTERRFVGYGGESGEQGVFIASVGSPTRRYFDDVRTRAASERSRLVACVRTI